MRKRRLIGPFLAVLFLGISTPRLPAQTITIKPPNGNSGPSHIEVPFHGPPSGRFEDFLKDRVESAREQADAYKRLDEILKDLRKHFSDEEIEALKRKGILDEHGRPPRLDDPRTRQLIEELLKKQQTQRELPAGDDQSRGFEPNKGMMDLLEKLLRETPQGRGFPSGTPMRPPDEANPPRPAPLPNIHSPPSGMPEPSVPSPPRAEALQPTRRPDRQEELREGINKWVNRLRDTPLGQSQTVRRIGSELSRPIFQRGDAAGERGEGLLSQLPRLGEYIPFKRLFMGDGPPSVRKPEWSSPRMPSMGAPGMSGAGGPGEGTLIGLLWIVLAAIVLVVLWRYFASPRKAAVQAEQAVWQLGPWPVNPAEVATRQDLIRAFEYLSLLLLGPAARVWNHREIAGRLGEKASDAELERRHAANHLASLYEQARYAPPHEPLPDSELSGARRDLCLLAGVASA
jgi:hypothetical protein